MGRLDHGDIIQKIQTTSTPIISYLDENYDKVNGLRRNVFNQLFKSITSVGANIAEANVTLTEPDFKRIVAIAIRETNESIYWLNLMDENWGIKLGNSVQDVEQILKILKTIVLRTGSR